MSNLRLRNYSEYTSRVSGLIGIPFSSMNTDEKSFLKGYFDTAIQDMWSSLPWVDTCPYGEARFAGNLLTYPNDMSQTTYWTSAAVTPTAASIANPADGRVTASKLLETSATSEHYVSQGSIAFVPSVSYQAFTYARPIGGRYLKLHVNDGAASYYAFFNLSAGTVGTTSGLSATPVMSQCANGFWLCGIEFTSNASASTGYFRPTISSDGSTTSYAGDTTKGIYSWGNLLLQTTYVSPTSRYIPWRQTGEREIEAVFQVWKDSPVGARYPRKQGYELTADGIQIVGLAGSNTGVIYNNVPVYQTATQLPVFLHYRKTCPSFSGDDYSATATYAVDDQVLFTNSSSVVNFYKCLVATSAGQSPTTTAASWELIEIPEVFFDYAVYSSYANWLRMDGQMDKAISADALAQRKLDDETDKQERQQGWVQETVYSTHITSRT